MMGGGGQIPNLKSLMQVKAIAYCHDTYRVTTVDDKTRHFRERNLRLKPIPARTVRSVALRHSCRL
jgi:cytochrome c